MSDAASSSGPLGRNPSAPGAGEDPQMVAQAGAALHGRLRAHLAAVQRDLGPDEADQGMLIAPEQAAAIVEARLGRRPQDALEASVVLEAWGGLRPGVALDLAAEVLRRGPAERPADAGRVPPGRAARPANQLVTLYGVLLIAIWVPSIHVAAPGSRGLLWQVVLPTAMALQWAIRRRFRIDDPAVVVASGRRSIISLAVVGYLIANLVWGSAGAVGATISIAWTVTTLIRRFRLLAAQTVQLACAPVALHAGVPLQPVLVAVVGLSLLSVAAELPAAGHGTGRPSSWPRTVQSLVAGLALGVAVVYLPGVRDHPGDLRVLLGFVPALVGGMVGMNRLQQLWVALPQALRGAPVTGDPDRAGAALARRIALSAVARAVVVTVVLSGLFMAADRTGELAPSFLQFGALGLVTMLASSLDGFRQGSMAVTVLLVAALPLALIGDAVGAALGLTAAVVIGVVCVDQALRDPSLLLARPL